MNYHMSPEQFREEGKKLIDWIADYYEQVEKYPVLSQVQPGNITKQLPNNAPEKGEEFSTVMKDVEQIIMPGITHWQSPNFFAYFQSNNSFPSILGDLLSSGLGVQGMLWATSPACTELETRVMDWLVDLKGLPKHFKSTENGGGVIQDTASSAVLAALLAARERKTNFACNQTGDNSGLVAYISTQTHSSVEKGVKVMGLGTDRLRRIEVDRHFAMRPDLLEKQIQQDLEAGLKPFFVCATIGTTSSNAVDPIEAIGRVCRQHSIWLHVDAAMSGTAALLPDYRQYFEGLELADSYAFNPHKWMFTNFDCDCFWVADKAVLIKTLSILPEYLKNEATEKGAVIDYRDWHVQLGRRFRSLKLWFVLRHYGAEGLRYHINQHIELTQLFTEWVKDSDDFELLSEPPFNLVLFRHTKGNEFNKYLMDCLNKDGKIYLTHTVLNGTFWLRMSIGQTQTEERHVQEAWRLIKEKAETL
ncbi:pyridoxal-dependent decarboxylase [Mangrovibacterium diazotrophicum]|uniref:Aromatic-L-amino-acid decarboxylase n=1 Tax=Mangrovibacterium diazotrophicum TaxID=1261403 RepID=A0A419VUZ9_9BACT|nr:pyridoxal-dependent decarboxylase [Mangrovibacterium diazotrophicum]RKD85984.1 aromatic-L-amino-acid decarboxylase [Mangrovibacterium diazotrophicum]